MSIITLLKGVWGTTTLAKQHVALRNSKCVCVCVAMNALLNMTICLWSKYTPPPQMFELKLRGKLQTWTRFSRSVSVLTPLVDAHYRFKKGVKILFLRMWSKTLHCRFDLLHSYFEHDLFFYS